MPHRDTIRPPTIVPLATPIPGYPTTHIRNRTRIELQTASPSCRIYFTTDGTDPDPLNTGVKGPGQTYRYKNPFRLKQGTRTVQAVAVHFTRREQSAVVSKTFTVGEEDSSADTEDMTSRNRYLRNGHAAHNIDSLMSETYNTLDSKDFSLEDENLEKYFNERGGSRVEDLFLSGGSDVETEVSDFFRAGIRDGRKSRRSHRDGLSSPISSRGDGLTDLYIADLEMTPRHEYGNRISYPSDLETFRSSNTVRFAEPEPDIDHYSPSPSPSYSEFTRVSSLPPEKTPPSYSESEHHRPNATTYLQLQEHHPKRYTISDDTVYPRERGLRDYSPSRGYSPAQKSWRDRKDVLSKDYPATRGFVGSNHDYSVRHNPVSSDSSKDYVPAITPRLQSEYDRQVQEELAKLRMERLRQERYSYPQSGHVAERNRAFQEYALLNRVRSRSPSPVRATSPSRYPMDFPSDPYKFKNGYRDQVPEAPRERHSRADEREEILKRRRERDLWENQEAKRLEQSRELQQVDRFEEKYEDEAREKQDSPEKDTVKKDKMKLEKENKDKKKKSKKRENRSSSSDSLSSSSSSSSSSLSLDNVLVVNGKSSKDKARSQKGNKVQDSSKKTNKKTLVKSNKGKYIAPMGKNEFKNGFPQEIIPRDILADKRGNNQPEKPHQNTGRTLQSSDGGLNFVNDSGTQINFWGVAPDEVMQQVFHKQTSGQAKTKALKNSVGNKGQDNDSLSLDDFFGTSSGPVNNSGSPDLQASPGLPVKNAHQAGLHAASSNGLHAAPSGKTIPQQRQAEQEGFIDSCKKFFKGWGGNKKSRETRPTVRDLEGSVQDVGGRKTLTYEAIRAKCLKSRRLFEDPDFPAVDSSLYSHNRPSIWPIEWKRPHEICQSPKLFVGGASRFDINQGTLGNCWFLAAVASLTTDKKLFGRVVPRDQSFDQDYAGVFRFQFWQYGRWVEVVVDDRLPTSKGQLVYMHSEDNNEFWSPLLEKACAKLCGCYESMSSGLTSEAMTDFTGGVCERFNFREELPFNMFQILLKAKERRALMGCSIDASAGQMEAKLDNGLVIGHAYSITDVKQMCDEDGDMVELVRVRNPWGNECEWNGAWSDKSEEWQSLSKEMKRELGLTFDHDGEFWMSFLDFSTHFQRVEICNLKPDSVDDLVRGNAAASWDCHLKDGAWRKKVNAGGCRNHRGTYYSNPHYRVTLTEVDDDDDEVTLIVGVMQKGRRLSKMGNYTIGYDLYKVEGSWLRRRTLDKSFFFTNSPVATSVYINMREVCQRHRLSPGEYVIVPTTFAPNEEADFIIRIFTEKKSGLVEVDENTCEVQASAMRAVNSAPEENLASEAEAEFNTRSGEDQEIDAYELKEILNSVFAKGFNQAEFDINLCRSLVALRDVDHTGMLGLTEFRDLWLELKNWKTVYQQHDKDQSGHFNSLELREALKSVGYQTSNATFIALVMRYSDRDGFVRFDDFVACVIKLKSMFEIFQQKAKEELSTFNLDEFIQMTMYS